MGYKPVMNQPFAGSNNRLSRMRSRRPQRGFTLLETLIAMALGLMVLAGVLQFVSRLVEANTSTLQVTRLEQDVRTIMDMMLQDIRVAGQFPEAASDIGSPAKFLTDQPALPTIDGQPLRSGQNGSALTYAYRETDGKLVSGRFSHDAKAGTILMHTGTASAPETISDPAFMIVTQLEFRPSVVQGIAGSMVVTLPTLEVRIVAHLKSDPAVERSLTDRVTWRNPVVMP